jgi:hypothetical protein
VNDKKVLTEGRAQATVRVYAEARKLLPLPRRRRRATGGPHNRARLRSGVARQAFRLRAERVERGFALILDRGGMRRVWLRSRENIQKRYLVHVAESNPRWTMRLTSAGKPREFTAPLSAWLFVAPRPDDRLVVIPCAVIGDQSALCAISGIWPKTQFLAALLGQRGIAT